MAQFLVINNAAENLVIASFTRAGTNNQIALRFNATPGTTYSLQYSASLETPAWSDIASVTSDGASVTYTETSAERLAGPKGFYCVVMPLVPDPVGQAAAASAAARLTLDPICGPVQARATVKLIK